MYQYWVYPLFLLLSTITLPASAHDYAELSAEIPAKHSQSALSLLNSIILDTEAPATKPAQPITLNEAAFLRAKIYQADGRATLLAHLNDSKYAALKAYLGSATYGAYIDMTDSLLYHYETKHLTDQDHNFTPEALKQLKAIQTEVEQWLE